MCIYNFIWADIIYVPLIWNLRILYMSICMHIRRVCNKFMNGEHYLNSKDRIINIVNEPILAPNFLFMVFYNFPVVRFA